MLNSNKIIITGRLVEDPTETEVVKGDKKFSKVVFKLLSTHSINPKQTNGFYCVSIKPSVVKLLKNVNQGDCLTIIGSMNQFEDERNGQKVYRWSVDVQEIMHIQMTNERVAKLYNEKNHNNEPQNENETQNENPYSVSDESFDSDATFPNDAFDDFTNLPFS